MTNPAQPAQPAEPAKPAQPYTGTGGYVGPAQRTQRAAPPRETPPGAPPSPGPSAPTPGVSSPISTTPVTAPGTAPGGPGVPAAAQSLGLDEKGYNTILEELKESPEPEEFKTQFSQLMEQRGMIAPRTQGTGTGQLPTEDYAKYLSKWVREAVAYGGVPKEMGGLGYTPGQAKMMAIVEARRRWPDIDGSYWATTLSGKVSPKDLGVTQVGSDKAAVEVSPYRAARLDPPKVADILTKKEFKTALEWAREYKERVGTGANSVDFVQDVFDRQVANMTTGGKKLHTAVEQSKAALANAEAMKAQAAVTADETQIAEAEAAYLKAKADKETAEAALLNTAVPDEAKSMETAVKFIQDNQDVLSVAAALEQLYS